MSCLLRPADAEGTRGGESALLGALVGRELERGQDYQIIESITQYREADGSISAATNSLTILATGMFYAENGQWRPSREEIEMSADGPVALQGPHQVRFPNDLGGGQPIELLNAAQERFRSRVLGLSYYNPANGQSVWVAEVQPSQAELLPPNRLIYRNAFDDVNADVLYEYRNASFSQDVVLRASQLPAPGELGLPGETVLLEVVTEFLDAPAPQQERRTVRLAGGLEVVDDALDFGLYQMPGGTAFWVDVGGRDDANLPPLRMFKRWEVIEGRTFLFEQVELSAVQALLASRVKAQASAGAQRSAGILAGLGVPYWPEAVNAPEAHKGSGAEGRQSIGRPVFTSRAALVRAIPALTQAQAGPSRYRAKEVKAAGAAALELPMANSQSPIRTPQSQIGNPKSQVASLTPGTPHSALAPGLVLDWTLLLSATNNFTFKGDTTYYVSGAVNLAGTNTIEGGTVVKFTNTASAKITFAGRVICQTGPYRPAIFTAKDDNSVGEVIPGSTGSPTNYYGNGLWFSQAGNSVRYVHIRFADTAVRSPGEANGLDLAHAQFVRVRRALSCASNGGVSVGNALFHSLQNVISGDDLVLRGQHLTVHDCDRFVDSRSTVDLYLTNSLLVALTNGWGYYGTLSTNAVVFTTNEVSGAFTNAVAGAHYLALDSTNRDAGTADISPWLLADLAKKTTYPPQELFENFTNDTKVVGSPAMRENYGPLDLGYHYDTLDFCWGGLNVTNGSFLLLTNGVAVGVYGVKGTTLCAGTKFLTGGDPQELVRLVRYQTVQEQPTNYAGTGSRMSLIDVPAAYNPPPGVQMRFTEISLMSCSYDQSHVLDCRQQQTSTPTYPVTPLSFTDCQIWNGRLMIYPGWSDMTVVGLTNNLLHRGYCYFDQKRYYGTQDFLLRLYNNLFYGGSLACYYNDTAKAWTIRNNLFDSTSIYRYGAPTSSHNGYYNTTTNLGGVSNITLSVTDYQVGPLGDYYYPLTGANLGLTNLIDKGSTTAGALRLYLYTTLINQAPDGHSTVDIGYHYTPVVNLLTVTNLPAAKNVDYHEPTNSLILSVNFFDGAPYNFARLDSNRVVTQWSGVAGDPGEIPIATARTTTNGFTAGETFYSPGVAVGRISPDGTTNTCPWAVLDIYSWAATGLHIDRTGVFGGDLIVVGCNYDTDPPADGAVWRIPGTNAPGTTYSNPLAALDTYLEGVLTCPNDTNTYGTNWAGKILIGAGFTNAVFAVDLAGNVTQTPLGFGPEDLHIIKQAEDFYSVNNYPSDYAGRILSKLPGDFFVNITDDFLMIQSGEWAAQERNGHLFLVHWDGAAFVTMRITDDEPRVVENGVFTPLSLATEP